MPSRRPYLYFLGMDLDQQTQRQREHDHAGCMQQNISKMITGCVKGQNIDIV